MMALLQPVPACTTRACSIVIGRRTKTLIMTGTENGGRSSPKVPNIGHSNSTPTDAAERAIMLSVTLGLSFCYVPGAISRCCEAAGVECCYQQDD
jgi:hypothetical protein